MAWDLTQPKDTTKLRNLGTVIRPNWVAIEEGDSSFKPIALNLDNRTPLVPPNDPVAIAETVILYSKDDDAGNPQGYSIDPSSGISHISAIKAWCRFVGNAASPITPTDGFNVANVTHGGGGSYTVNFTNNLQNATYAVFSMSSRESLLIVSTAASNCVVKTSSLTQPAIVTVMVIGS